MRLRTSANFTYVMGSHVMQFGTLALQGELAGDYEGTLNKGVEAKGVLCGMTICPSLH